jgi:hypothetical protein
MALRWKIGRAPSEPARDKLAIQKVKRMGGFTLYGRMKSCKALSALRPFVVKQVAPHDSNENYFVTERNNYSTTGLMLVQSPFNRGGAAPLLWMDRPSQEWR